MIDKAIDILLADRGLTANCKSAPRRLFTLRYSQEGVASSSCFDETDNSLDSGPLQFSRSLLDLALSDRVLDEVQCMWKKVLNALDDGFEEDNFMIFDERDNLGGVDEENGDRV